MNLNKGIILAGGTGSRLFPVSSVINKHFLPIYNKPMIYYPLSILMLLGIRDILIICNEKDLNSFRSLLGDGSNFGISISFKIQDSPKGISEAFLIGKEFISEDNVALILGDNFFYGNNLYQVVEKAVKNNKGATIFGYDVQDPERFGVIEYDKKGQVKKLIEKPKNPTSNQVATGLYIYKSDVVNLVKKLSPSSRGELEITDLNKLYLEEGRLNAVTLNRGFVWFDVGTFDAFNDASNFIQNIEDKQKFKIACLEEISFNHGWLDKDTILKNSKKFKGSDYHSYLENILR